MDVASHVFFSCVGLWRAILYVNGCFDVGVDVGIDTISKSGPPSCVYAVLIFIFEYVAIAIFITSTLCVAVLIFIF